MPEPPLSDLEKFRRLVITIQVAAFNFGYWRGAKERTPEDVDGRFKDIQIRIDNNFLDIGVFEWCKLFAERESQHWKRKIASDAVQEFADGLYALTDKDEAEWKAYVDEFLLYRDKFLGHLDSLRTMNIPQLDAALKALHFYAQYLLTNDTLASTVEEAQLDIERIISDACQNAKDYLR